MGVPADWYQTFFTGITVEMWLHHGTPEVTLPEVEFLERHLQLPPGAGVLDVPCGGGRHAVELAARGYAVTGIDLSPEFLEHARAAAVGRGVAVEWREGDMRDLPWEAVFDGAYCLGTCFGYLDEEGNTAFVAALARALKPGARLVLDASTAAEAVLPNFHEQRWYDVGDMVFLIRNGYDLEASRIEPELTFIRDGQVEKRSFSQRVYTYRELCGLLRAHGFSDMQGYGGLQDEPFRLGAQRLWLVATRH